VMRRSPRKVGRALGDWLRRHRGERVSSVDPDRRSAAADAFGRPVSRAWRIRQLETVRVTPFQLRRGLPW